MMFRTALAVLMADFNNKRQQGIKRCGAGSWETHSFPQSVLSFVPLITLVVSLEFKMAGTREHYGNNNVIV